MVSESACKQKKVNGPVIQADELAIKLGILQPMNQGIIANFKNFYRRSIAFSVVKMLDSDITDPLNINIKDAIDRTVKAWKSVKASAISNCFAKAGHAINN